jgi:hypothetical protein
MGKDVDAERGHDDAEGDALDIFDKGVAAGVGHEMGHI